MAKDRTRHARIREPKQESQADIVMRNIIQTSKRISEDIVLAVNGFDNFAAELTNFVKVLLEEQNGEH